MPSVIKKAVLHAFIGKKANVIPDFVFIRAVNDLRKHVGGNGDIPTRRSAANGDIIRMNA